MKPTGIAKSLNIGDPAAGAYALEASAARAAGWSTPTTTRSARASGCSPDHRRIRRDGRRRDRRYAGKLVETGKLDPERETVIYNTGEGLKTLDAVCRPGRTDPPVKPSLKAAKEAGLLES